MNMKKWLSILLAAGLLLYPFATFGIDYGSQTSQTQQAPPVAQTLVREGDFAVDLATELDLGNTENEAVAEDRLAKAGVAPSNGWISDYPVTPEIIAQLKDSISRAADSGTLSMNSREATNGLYSLAGQYNLPVPAGPGSAGTLTAAPANPTVVNNYYYDQGPPVVSYYPPPADYLYLYDWVPFPVVWFGFWFPGFFICHNFTTVVVVRTPFVAARPAFVTRRAIVSNAIVDRRTGASVVVDPVVRTSGGVVRPVTALRTTNGTMFGTMTDMRRGASMNGVSAFRTATVPRPEGFSSPEARQSARNIVTRTTQGSGYRSGSAMGVASERHSSVQAAPARDYRSSTMRGPGVTPGTYSAPHPSPRSYNAPASRGGRSPGRWFNGNGNGGWGRRG